MRVFAVVLVAVVSTACHHQLAEDHSSHMMSSMAPDRSSGTGATELPASNGASAARVAASPRRGEWVKVPFDAGSKDTIMAWIVYPSNARAKAPVVVIVHDIGGLSVWARGVADQVAAEGFIGVTPDFTSRLRGSPSSTELPRDSAGKLMALVNSAERSRIISAVAKYAMSRPNAEQNYGVIGYCWGGTTAFMHAVNGGTSGFGGAVAYYGLPYMDGPAPIADSLANIRVPMMLFNGAKDARIGAAIPAVDSVMKRLGKTFTSTNYDGATHGFMRSQDDPKATRDLAEEAANFTATKDAWPRTIDFLKRNLGAK
jgi:carboxymethylenebutenolidase